MDTNMVFTLLSCRSAAEPIFFTLTFTVSYGPPSTVVCKYDNFRQIYFNTREDPLGLSREVIRSHYVNSSYPDMTRVTLTLTAPRVSRSYTCTVTVEGRVNIGSHNYDYFPMGSGTVTANITGECVTAVLNSTSFAACSSSQLQAPQQMSLLTGLVMTVPGFPGLPHQQEHHQLAMRCSIS